MQLTGQNFLGYERSGKNPEVFTAWNPSSNQSYGLEYHNSSNEEIDHAMAKAAGIFPELASISKKGRADFLNLIADMIQDAGELIVETCTRETGLPPGRIAGERTRTINQIRMFADLLREGSWVEAVIDTALPDRQPAPRPDIRRMLIPIGPVVVFGASNFPLAFSVAGGDTISALAAGNPVIVKAHPAHPGTSEIVANCIIEAAKKSGMPDGTFSLLFDSGYKTGKYLVVHPKTCAVAFTGSFSGGKALYDLAQTRINPIPVFAEMGSVNPVFILPQALKQSSPSIAKALAGSITLGAGQFCTNPGLIFLVDGPGSEEFLESLVGNIRKSIPETMLTPKIAANFRSSVKHLLDNQPIQKRSESGTTPGQNQSGALVAQVDGSTFEQSPQLAEEIFGPFSLIIKCSSIKQLLTIAGSLSGQLTASIFYDSLDDLRAVSELPGILRNKAGRIVFNGVPTGVEVCPAMNHGGPFPASTDGRFSSVGTSAIKRFVRPVAFQDCPDSLLPDELKDYNPMAISRLVNGKIEIRQ